MSDLSFQRLACAASFEYYARTFLKVVEPETVFEWNWHLTELCVACEKLYYGEIQNLDINIPPRTLKTIIVSVLFPCWVWTKKNSTKIMSASSSFELSNSINIKRRDLIRSAPHQTLFPITLKDHADRISFFENTSNGFMRAVSVGSKVTGSGADILISDDLLDAKDAFSKTTRDATNHWYSKVFYGRAQDKRTVKRININQRLHQDDVSGHIRKEHNFERLVLAMEKTAVNDSTIYYNDPRSIGDFLFPQRYGDAQKADEYKSLGAYGWSSQMQQNPISPGGGIIKTEWLRYYDQVPVNFSKMIITGDLNFQAGESSDFACFQCWILSNGNKYLVDVIRGQWSYKTTKEMFAAFCAKHPRASIKWIENKANGPALISDMKDLIPGIRAWPDEKSPLKKADKVQRLHLSQPEFEGGTVYFPKPENIELVELMIAELMSFTDKGSATGHDDMVDTMTMALLELKSSNTFFY